MAGGHDDARDQEFAGEGSGEGDPEGNRSLDRVRRSPRRHGPERERQDDPRAGPGRALGLRGHGGTARFQGKDLLAMKPEDRAREGVFMAFQYPVEIPGVSNAYFLKAALNAIRKYRGLEEIDAMDFMGLVQDKAKLLGLDETFMKRGLNEGFSG